MGGYRSPEREAERYLVSVEDDGIGIPDNELAHVFERFPPGGRSTTRRHSGNGDRPRARRSLVECTAG